VTRNEALLWLNGRIGNTVHVSVVLLRDHEVHVLEGDGPLQHWTEGFDARPEPDPALCRRIVAFRHRLI
jgi:hypothetical protein